MQDRIPLRQNFAFALCKGKQQYCSYCGEKMTNRWGLSIAKETTEQSHYNIWFCMRCVGETIPRQLRRWYQKYRDDVIIEAL